MVSWITGDFHVSVKTFPSTRVKHEAMTSLSDVAFSTILVSCTTGRETRVGIVVRATWLIPRENRAKLRCPKTRLNQHVWDTWQWRLWRYIYHNLSRDMKHVSGTLSLSRELYDMISMLYSCVRVFLLHVILLCLPAVKNLIMASHFYKRN